MSVLEDEKSSKSTTKLIDEKAEGSPRKKWSSKLDFFFTGLSYAVGLGNIWRFPYLCYTNGGGAFLIPYFTMLVLVGIPFYLLESALGQYVQRGPLGVWVICPLFKGLGYSMFMIAFFVGIYYNMLMSWSLDFLYHSFTLTLPWTTCNNTWNTPFCRTTTQLLELKAATKALATFAPGLNANATSLPASFINATTKSMTYSTPSEEFFHNRILDLSPGVNELGMIRLEPVICLFIAWTIVFLCLIKGVSSLGKAAYFTAVFPYIVLTAFVIRALTLPGSMQGISFYLTPEWDKLLELQVWCKAAMQIFFSLSPCWGCLITISSYNDFNANCVRDSIVICVANCLTSFYGGFAIFAVLGFMAHTKGVEVSTVVNSGAGLAFIAYPEAIGQLPFPPIWSFLFFLMLISLGMGTQFSIVESIVTSIVDIFPMLRRRALLVLLCTCMVYFILGLILCTRGGMYILILMDDFCASYSSLAVGTVEALVIAYVYGASRFTENIKEMLQGRKCGYSFWKFMFRILPLSSIGILMTALVVQSPSRYGRYEFPHWTSGFGYCLSSASFLCIPVIAIFELMKHKGTLMQRIRTATVASLPKRDKTG